MYKTRDEIKTYLLAKHGLLNEHRLTDKQDIPSFFDQVGCIQFDPIDICGRNADLVLFSRVKYYKKAYLDEMLYKDRILLDQWDKVMSIYQVSDYNQMERVRNSIAKQYEIHLKEHQKEISLVLDILKEKEFVDQKDLNIDKLASFYTWRHTNLGKAILDYLFFKGDVVIHHREGVKKNYGLKDKYIENHLIDKNKPIENDDDFYKFQIKRRIEAVGMLSSGASDAYLGLLIKTPKRKKLIHEMVLDGELTEINVLDTKIPYYILTKDIKYFDINQSIKRVEFIAPLDNLLWDRKLIKNIFDFTYKWEIYHTPSLRKFAPYALPILYNDDFIGQIELTVDRKQKTLIVKNIWFKNKKPDRNFNTILKQKLKDFMQFNECKSVDMTQMNTIVYKENPYEN